MGGGRVLVLGDVMLDQFLWGKVARISPEAPVPVVRAQNMPSRKVPNSGAFTKPNTNWMMSIALAQLLTR